MCGEGREVAVERIGHREADHAGKESGFYFNCDGKPSKSFEQGTVTN